jgi:hypothetical protein
VSLLSCHQVDLKWHHEALDGRTEGKNPAARNGKFEEMAMASCGKNFDRSSFGGRQIPSFLVVHHRDNEK